jgi:hypothetical protein
MAKGRAGSGPYTKDSPQVAIRLEPELDEALEQAMRREGVTVRGEMVRRLMKRGLASLADGAPLATPGALPRDAFAERAQAHVQALSDLLARQEGTDPAGALLAARGVEDAVRRWSDDRAGAYGLGLSADERMAQLVDSVTVLVRTTPTAERLSLWEALEGAVRARVQEDDDANDRERLRRHGETAARLAEQSKR